MFGGAPVFFAQDPPENCVPAEIRRLFQALWSLCSCPGTGPGAAPAACSWINIQTGSFVGQRFLYWLTASQPPSPTSGQSPSSPLAAALSSSRSQRGSEAALPSPEAVAQLFLDLRIFWPESHGGLPHSVSGSISTPGVDDSCSGDSSAGGVFDPSRRYVFSWLAQPLSVNAARLWCGPARNAEVISERLQLLLQEFLDCGYQDQRSPGVFHLDAFLQSDLFASRWAWQLCELQRADLSTLAAIPALALLLNLYNILWISSVAVSKQPPLRRKATISVAGLSLSMEDLLLLIRGEPASFSSSSSSSSSSPSSSSPSTSSPLAASRRALLPPLVARDPRFHFALLRGKNGPWLSVWAPATLCTQLATATAEFLDARLAVSPDALTVVAPTLFDAYRSDFTRDALRDGDDALLDWLAANATGKTRDQLKKIADAGRPFRFKFSDRQLPFHLLAQATGVISKNVRSIPANVRALPTRFAERQQRISVTCTSTGRPRRPHSGLHPEEIEQQRTQALLADLAAQALHVPNLPCLQQRHSFSDVHQALAAVFKHRTLSK